MKLNNISSVRILKTTKHGVEVFVLVIGFTNGNTDVTTHLSDRSAFARLKNAAPHLNEKFFKVENV